MLASQQEAIPILKWAFISHRSALLNVLLTPTLILRVKGSGGQHAMAWMGVYFAPTGIKFDVRSVRSVVFTEAFSRSPQS